MTVQEQYKSVDGGREEPHGFPTRAAAAIVILAALSLADAAPRLADETQALTPSRHEQSAPSACGAEAVARAQREVGKPRVTIPTALS